MKIKQIEKRLKKALRTLSREYRASLESGSNAWLRDNYYCFERDGASLLSFYSDITDRNIQRLLTDLYLKCRDIAGGDFPPDSEKIAEAFSGKDMSILAFEYAPAALKTAILIHAGENASDESETEKCVKGLKAVDETDFEQLCSAYCENEKLLSADGIYPQMPPEVKSLYRKRIFALSKLKNESEKKTIASLLKNGRHIGFYLFGRQKSRNTALIFIEAILVFFCSLAVGVLIGKPLTAALFLFPVWQIADAVLSVSQTRKNPPEKLLRLEKDAVPDSAKTLVTVSCLLPNAKDCEKIGKHLTRLYAANRDKNIRFCLLADKKEFSSSEKPDDRANINALKRVIDKLNIKYGNCFYLFIREREYSKTGSCFTGKNRKMGALCSLVRLIRHGENEFETAAGDRSSIPDFKYILALDSDTRLGFGSAKRLIMTALHPLNRAVIDRENRKIKSGYGIFSLRMQSSVIDESSSYFSLLMSGSGGGSAYDEQGCERFSDVFGSGIFAGKGLIDIDAYDAVICDRFRDERILSHDILEGELLNTLYVSDVQALDSFPKSEHSFLSRMHRWTRGDWQNIVFLFPHPSVFRKRERNPLPFISRYKLFDNLRRSVTPVFSMLLLLCSVFFDGNAAAVMITVSLIAATAGELISFFTSLVSGGFAMLSRLYYSDAIPASLSKITQAAINIMSLPVTAAKSLDAVLKALFRQFITKKKMLEWTTAADSEKDRPFLSSLWFNMPNIVCAVFLFVFRSPYTALCAVFFIMNILFVCLSQKPIKSRSSSLDSLTRERLLSHAAAQWKYYEDYSSESENYLPADNVQFSPVFRVAHRTSPTNIGLYLVCALAAGRNGFIGRNEMLDRIDRSLQSVEKLKKYKGNLYNWYDTKTLMPLEPGFISTVDSGNFLCCLTALKEGLKDYRKTSQKADSLIERIERIIGETDLSFLYSKKRRLFHIGFDINENSLSPSYYDLMMSEARMTSYFAVSKGITDIRHWGALSRIPGKLGRYTGPLSWSGTMFEYFMPSIFQKTRKNTFYYEGLRFCLYCQTVFAKAKKIPWGVSESAFYGFDGDYNYQYKAHGINRLRLNRSSPGDTVVSPYSSYLALPFSPKKAANNIKRLERLHMLGPYGLYEAADFTRERIENREYAVIKSYMAHHIGMSLLSIMNAADDFIFQKYFMSDIDMTAGQTLLDEQIPTFTPLIRNPGSLAHKQKDERRERFVRESNSFSVTNPKAACYSNGEWSLSVCENGVTKSTYRDKCIFTHGEDFIFDPHSVAAVFRANGVKKYFCPFMNLENKDRYRTVFRENEAVITYCDSDIKLTQRLSVHKYMPAEKRSFTVQNLSRRRFDGELLIYLEPSLNTFEAEKSHPAFSRLFVSEEFNRNEKILSFSRRDRDTEKQLALSCSFLKKTDFSFTGSRENVLKRPYGIFSLGDFDNNFTAARGAPDCCGLFSVPLKLSPKEKKTVTLLFSAAKNVRKSEEILITGRQNGLFSSFESAPAVLGQYSRTSVLAKEILPSLLFRPDVKGKAAQAIRSNNSAVDALWSKGISGDRPIILFDYSDENDLLFLKSLLKIHNAFSNAFIKNDLVILCSGRLKESVSSVLKTDGLNSGGIFVLDRDETDGKTLGFLYAFASFTAESKISGSKKDKPFTPVEILAGRKENDSNRLLQNGYSISASPVLPWCFVYSNDCFGTVVSDKSAGFTYSDNSFFNRLTGWSNDTRRDFASEIILIKADGKYYNPLLNSNVIFTAEKAVYRCTCGGIVIETEISVEKARNRKNITVRAKGSLNEKIEIVFSAEPLMSSAAGRERLLHFEKQENAIAVSNPLNSDFNGRMYVGLNENADIYVFDKLSLFAGDWGNFSPEACRYPIAAIGKTVLLTDEAELNFYIGYDGGTACSCCEPKNSIEIASPDRELDSLFNTFLPVQIIGGRLRARTGFYQCSGAYGFRDQLQDALSLSILFPEKLREQILINCCAQFTEGDCLHWFHLLPDEKLKGVRTRYSDDRLWLPLAVCEYVNTSGDSDLLNEKVPFLVFEELKKNETEKYIEIYPSDEYGTVFEHCIRAIEKSLSFGRNGLPLIMGGDWNDGYNTVGKDGNGESVWLGEFLIIVLERFSAFCDEKTRQRYKIIADSLRESIDANAFSDGWFIRAFHDDGSPLGSRENPECRIDSLSQSFAVFCNMPDRKKVGSSLENAEKLLVDRENGLIKLFSDGFENDRRAGYISAYPVGLRENAGQYTHAAVWLAKAFIDSGQPDKGYELLEMLNPLKKYCDAQTAKRYMTEPYFLAGDVYSAKGIEGRGGWSIYTGSAGWYYKTVLESVFGLKKLGKKLFINPRFPSGWDKCILTLTLENTEYKIEFSKNGSDGLFVDGEKKDYLCLDGISHKIIVNYSGKNRTDML